MKAKPEHVISLLLLTCTVFGLFAAGIGLGAGLIFLNVQQSIGIGLLSFGVGASFSGTFGAKAILKALIQTIREMETN